MPKLLTKSNYLIGLQCPKLLWITKNDKQRIPKPDEITQKKFDDGTFVGELATIWYPRGVDLSGVDFKDNLEKTKKLVEKRVPIFEAGFIIDNLYSRADILVPFGKDEWDIIEVKSATKVKNINLHDVAFQKYVYEKSGLKINKCYLMHINNQYVLDGEVESEELFIQTDITEEIVSFSKDLKSNIERFFKIIEGDEPEFSVDDILTIEYNNICLDNFVENLPEGNVFEFYRMLKKKAVGLYKDGYKTMKDTPEDIKLNEKQMIQKTLAHDGGVHINREGIKNFLDKLEYPIYYLDFETINPIIPKFNGMKPYQRIPFQFSLHIQEEKDGECKHISFLADDTDEPRTKFMKALKDNLGDKGSILVYNQGFEKGVMRECSDAFPRFKKWYEENIESRIKDLWDVFRNFDYYDSRQKGSASIKYVLPVLSDLSYSEMDIKNGALASFEYERVTFDPSVSDEDRDKVRADLEEYCALDTLAEVEIIGALRRIANNKK